MMLNDAAITNVLSQTVEKIKEGALEQAQAGLAVAALGLGDAETALAEAEAAAARWGEEGGEVRIPKIQE